MLRWIAVLYYVFAIGTAQAAPAHVVIFRHGEKPSTGSDLSPQGYRRAQALVGYFADNPTIRALGKPAAVFAMSPHGPNGTLRPIETVTPLADALGLSVVKDFEKKQVNQLVDRIMNDPTLDDQTVVICWEHSYILNIVQAFGYDSAPDVWQSSVFDRTWILGFTGERVTSFQDVPQKLLSGDSTD